MISMRDTHTLSQKHTSTCNDGVMSFLSGTHSLSETVVLYTALEDP